MNRRHFIATAATGLVASQFASAQEAKKEEKKEEKRIGFAFVGIGSLTRNQLLPAIGKCKRARLAALVTGDPEGKGKQMAEKFAPDREIKLYNYQTYDTIKDNPDVDVIYIVLPNSMHAEYTIRGFKSGKHVLCEKPMANTVKECDEMIAAAKQAKKKLMIAYRLRYETHNPKAIEIVRSGELGTLKAITAEAGFPIGDPKQWRLNKQLAGGGSMMDIGIYALNATRYLSGEEPAEVTATIYTTPGDPRFKEVEETILFDMKFPSGLVASCTSSYGFGCNRFRAVGTKGWVEAEPFLSYNNLSLYRSARGGREKIELPQVDHFAAEMDHMADCVLNNKEPLTHGEEGLKDMKVITAIYEAASSGKTVKL